jgi:Sec7-like guanine-nucleotide exchange factor
MRRERTPDRGRNGRSPRASVSIQSPEDGVIRQRAPIETPVQLQRQSTVASEESPSALRWMEDRPSARRQTWSEACSPANASRAAHRAPRAVLAMFNSASSAAKGLKALRAKGFLAEGAQAVCNFFIANDGKLDLVKIGDFLGSDSDECRAVCRFMIGSLPLAGLSLDSSLRRVIALVKLPGEAQKIDRIIEAFAGHFCSCNPGAIDHVDTAQILAFSLVMLNTD